MVIKRRKIKRGRVEIIPMVDTIVILLIFYMTFSRFAEMTYDSKVELPSSVAGDEFEKRPDQIIVNMFSGDDVRVGGAKYVVANLPRVLLEEKQQHPTLSVVVRGNKQMPYRDLNNLMGACAKAGISDVTFATLEAR
ncbi:MAG: biopolymer transporter ExbD [Verrucomicrobiia bacterium]